MLRCRESLVALGLSIRQQSRRLFFALAMAFPGTASSPTYVNTTGERVVLHSGAFVSGECDAAKAENEFLSVMLK